MTAFINRLKQEGCILTIRTLSFQLIANLQGLSLIKIISQTKPPSSTVPPPPPRGRVFEIRELEAVVNNSSTSDAIVPPVGDDDHRLTIISSSSSSFSLPQYHLLVLNDVNPNNPNTWGVGVAPTSLTVFQKSELGKTIFAVVVPVTMGLLGLIYNFSNAFPLWVVVFVSCTLSFGTAFIWNGILLRDNFPRFSGVLEEIGVSLVFLAFFALVTSILPPYLIWAPGLCYLLILLPPVVLRFHAGHMQGM